MRILLLSRYERLGASSRYRSYQYLPSLQARGHEIVVSPLLSDRYLKSLYNKSRIPMGEVLRSYVHRVKATLSSACFDLLWIEYEAFPWVPASLEAFLVGTRIPYVVDYDDAVFHRYDLHRLSLIRSALGRKIDSVMRHAAVVIAGNAYIAERAAQAGAQRVEILPTVIDRDKYAASPPRHNDAFTIGWIGSPTTSRYLYGIEEALRQVCTGGRARLRVIGDMQFAMGDVPLERVPWAEETEAHEISKFDVGVMPLPDNPWERGKCGHKLILYMACSRPVVASPIGVNQSLVENGVNGYLADSVAGWISSLENLRTNPELCLRMGCAGRAKVEARYTLQVTAPSLASILESVCRIR